jgi:hypothetical protein
MLPSGSQPLEPIAGMAGMVWPDSTIPTMPPMLAPEIVDDA